MKIFIVGSLNMDLVIRAPFMPENGVTINGEGFMTNPGGKGANQATAVGKLGGNAYMVGCVGDAFGDELKATLEGYKVNTEYVEKKSGKDFCRPQYNKIIKKLKKMCSVSFLNTSFPFLLSIFNI